MIQINANPHPTQREVHDCPARFRVVDAGRRWGKTRLGVMECIEAAAAGKRAWWVAPSYPMAMVGWRPLKRISSRIPGSEVRLGDMQVNLPGGGEVRVRSADNPDSLRGEGLDFVVMDEAAFTKPETWSEALRPALSDKGGRALFISTPRGRNWFWELYTRGTRNEEGWQSFCFPTSSNPYIPRPEIESAQRDLPEIIFRQEYLAEFIDDQGGVFRRVQDAIYGDMLAAPEPGKQYTAGVDVAASIDYTVCTVMDNQTKRAVYIDRFNRVDYNALEDRLAALYKAWGLLAMTVEANSIGQGVIDHLRARNMTIIPFTTTSATKQAIVQGLQSAFEHGLIGIPNYTPLIGELLSFESKRNASGSFSYSAPDGLHDDCVMSLAITWEGITARTEVLFEV